VTHPAPGNGPWRILVLDPAPGDPRWLLATIEHPDHVRPATVDGITQPDEVTAAWVGFSTGLVKPVFTPMTGATLWRIGIEGTQP
jgi:hypothetical protein